MTGGRDFASAMQGVTLAQDFDRLCDVLARAETLEPMDALVALVEAGATVPLDSELKVWWLVAARNAYEVSCVRARAAA